MAEYGRKRVSRYPGEAGNTITYEDYVPCTEYVQALERLARAAIAEERNRGRSGWGSFLDEYQGALDAVRKLVMP